TPGGAPASIARCRSAKRRMRRSCSSFATPRGRSIPPRCMAGRRIEPAGCHRGWSLIARSVEPDMKRLMAAAALALAPLCAADMASAQNYPARSIQVIVPFAGGSASDVITRVLLERMGTSMGRRFIVDNRPGAGGNTGTAAAAKADPDGYTLVMSTLGPLAANKTFFRDLSYARKNVLEPISLFAIVPNVIVVSAKLPVTSLKEFIAYAKSRPKEINYGSLWPRRHP